MPHTEITRRTMLRGTLAAIGVGGIGEVLAACTGASSGGGGGTGPTGSAGGSSGGSKGGATVSVGSNYSDAVPKAAFAKMLGGFASSSGDKTTINTVAHNDFQNNINNYLQGSPDDVFTWFAGFRMRFYAKKDLVAPIDDVWQTIGPNLSDAFAKASTGDDGKKYLVPLYNYPWGFFYRKSVWQQNNYQIPTTWDAFLALCKQMKKDNITPIAFADKDQWPACGTFDYLNMRINGYDFHVSLMAHEKSWNSAEVKKVFDTWREILPYHDTNGAFGRTWQDSAQTLLKKKTGMYLLGSFVAQQFTGADLADLDFFPFPAVDPSNGQDAVEAPIDGLMLSKKAANNSAAKALLTYCGGGPGQSLYIATDPSDVAAAKNADSSKYNAIQKKAQTLIAGAKQISQFLDRDALPAFATDVMEPALADFVKNGKFDTSGVETQAKQVYASAS